MAPGDFPGDPVVNTSSNAGAVCSIPGWGAKIPHAWGPTNIKKRSNIVTHSVKTKIYGSH